MCGLQRMCVLHRVIVMTIESMSVCVCVTDKEAMSGTFGVICLSFYSVIDHQCCNGILDLFRNALGEKTAQISQ